MIYNADASAYIWADQKKNSGGEDTNTDWITAVELGDYVASLVDGRLPGVHEVVHSCATTIMFGRSWDSANRGVGAGSHRLCRTQRL